MTRALVALGLVASVMVLAGCGAAPPLPEPLTQEEVDQKLQQQRSESWAMMFPSEPEPMVDMIKYQSEQNESLACVAAANIDGVTVTSNGISADGSEAGAALNRQMFICSKQYPPDPADVVMLSDAEDQWLYDYNTTRLVPCLTLMGYRINDQSGQFSSGNRGSWVPYFNMRPIPSQAQWKQIDLRCPPPPVGPDYTAYRPTRD